MTSPRQQPDLVVHRFEHVIEQILDQVSGSRVGLTAGDEFTVVAPLLAELTDLGEADYESLTEEIDRRAGAYRVMVEAMHDVKCDFVVY